MLHSYLNETSVVQITGTFAKGEDVSSIEFAQAATSTINATASRQRARHKPDALPEAPFHTNVVEITADERAGQ